MPKKTSILVVWFHFILCSFDLHGKFFKGLLIYVAMLVFWGYNWYIQQYIRPRHLVGLEKLLIAWTETCRQNRLL